MKTHKKKKLEIIAEAALLPRLVDLLDEQGVKGHTVLPVLAGHGHSGAMGATDLNTALAMRLLVAVMDGPTADALLTEIHALLGDYRAVVLVSDIEVLREDYF